MNMSSIYKVMLATLYLINKPLFKSLINNYYSIFIEIKQNNKVKFRNYYREIFAQNQKSKFLYY